MQFLNKLSVFLRNTSASVATLIKVALMSRRPSPRGSHCQNDRIVVLGNGPSLNTTLSQSREFISSYPLMAVNFAANTDLFFEICPKYYVLADPHFFTGNDIDANVKRLWDNFASITWPMTLFVPCCKSKCHKIIDLSANKNIIVKYFNLTPAGGFTLLRHMLFRHGLAMPRPRNVLIPALMLALREGFGKIYVAGADHSWTKTLGVDDNNHVVSIQPHFYNDTASEHKRVATEYAGYHLHDILNSLYIAFKSYFDIADYAINQNAEIINITPESFIDAFPRMKPPIDKIKRVFNNQ